MTRVEAVEGDQTRIRVEFAAPPAELAPYISAYYAIHVDLGERVEDYLRPEWTNIRIMTRGYWEAQNPGEALLPVIEGIVQGPTSQMAFVRGRDGGASFGMAFCLLDGRGLCAPMPVNMPIPASRWTIFLGQRAPL